MNKKNFKNAKKSKKEYVDFYAPNGVLVMSLTPKEIEKEITKHFGKLVELSCELNSLPKNNKRGCLRSLKDVAEHILEMEAGTLVDRCILAFMLENYEELNLPLDNHFCYAENYKEVK